MIKVCIAGATGWAGSALSKGVFSHPEMQLVAAVSRKEEGKNLADILELGPADVPVFSSVQKSLTANYDVLVEYTKPEIAKQNILVALNHGINVVVGTSGLLQEEYEEIEKVAVSNNASVLAVGNFSITAVLMQKFSEMAARIIPRCEIIDYASASKLDAPSGTALELAHRLAKIQAIEDIASAEITESKQDSRGLVMENVHIHSVRLPGYIISIESLFGMEDEKLSIRHDAGSGAQPYVKGGMIAISRVNTFKGLRRGLDSVIDFFQESLP